MYILKSVNSFIYLTDTSFMTPILLVLLCVNFITLEQKNMGYRDFKKGLIKQIPL